MNTTYANEHSYFIPMIDAADIIKKNIAGLGVSLYKPYKKANGSMPMRADKNLFSSTFRFCLETAELESAYGSLKKGSFSQDSDDDTAMCGCTDALVCVTFEYGYKAYNKFSRDCDKKGTLYVKSGYAYRDGKVIDKNGNSFEIKDGICIENGEILAVVTSSNTGRDDDERESDAVETNALENIISPFFEYDSENRQYSIRHKEGRNKNKYFVKINTEKSADEIRDCFYLNGFDCLNKKGEKIHYVRYKRSAGMSRENKCIFIREDMLKKMLKWSTLTDAFPATKKLLKKHNLTINEDIVSAEAYGALSLSSLEDTLHLDINNILFMKDVTWKCYQTVMKVCQDESNDVTAKAEKSKTESNIFDGEALLDESVFEECGRKNKGMMLLRNRYFKSCAFNTKLRKWFEDNKITDISQLNGITLATDISQVKMVVTESSLKFCKMLEGKDAGFESKVKFWSEWLGEDGCDFGIVKSEKPTPYLAGNLVRTNYQMLNTLNLSDKSVDKLLEPSEALKYAIRTDSSLFRYYLSEFCGRKETFEDDDETEYIVEKKQPDIYGYKDQLVSTLLEQCPDFSRTKMYQRFRSDCVSKINDYIKKGKLLVHGTNAVLFGNGYDFLLAAITPGYRSPWLIKNSEADRDIYCPFFKNGTKLLGIRSPHITMGNALIADNVYDEKYRYFNLTPEIVCVGARNNNLQHILNGADYDSDTILLTDNEILVESGMFSRNNFPVPVNAFGYEKAKNSLTKIDIEIGKNKIGEIVNLSQKFNSVLWSMMFRQELIPKEYRGDEAILQVYHYCAILEVLSNTEIDKAKRIYSVDSEKELKKLQKIYRDEYEEYFPVPDFFTYITTGRVCKPEPGKQRHTRTECPMQYIYDRAGDKNTKRTGNGMPLSQLLTEKKYTGADTKTVNGIIAKASAVSEKRNNLNARFRTNRYKIHNSAIQNMISRETITFFRSIKQEKLTEGTIAALLKYIDEADDIREEHWLLLAALCNSGRGGELDFGNNGSTKLYGMLKQTESDDYDKARIKNQITEIFGI